MKAENKLYRGTLYKKKRVLKIRLKKRGNYAYMILRSFILKFKYLIKYKNHE